MPKRRHQDGGDSVVQTAVGDRDEILKSRSADRASISVESIEFFYDQAKPVSDELIE